MARGEVSTKTEKGEKISCAGTLIDGQPCYKLFQRLLHVRNVHCTMQFDIAISDKDQSDLCSSYCVSPAEFLDMSSNIFSSFISLMSHSQKCCKSLKSVCSDFLLNVNNNVNNLKSKTFIRLQAHLYLSWSPLVSQSLLL